MHKFNKSSTFASHLDRTLFNYTIFLISKDRWLKRTATIIDLLASNWNSKSNPSHFSVAFDPQI